MEGFDELGDFFEEDSESRQAVMQSALSRLDRYEKVDVHCRLDLG